MSEAFITRRGGGGGGAGATLTVSAPAGATAKIAKDGKTKTKTVGSDGTALFTGLTGGQWMASIYDSTHEETTPVTVTVTTDYAITLSFFAAYISINYPAGSTCYVSKGSIRLDAPDTLGQWTCIVPEAGTWTVTATNEAETATQEVVISGAGETASVVLSYWTGELYTPNNEYYHVTGGWEGYTHKNDGNLEIITNNGTMVYMRPVNQIDVTNYTTATLTCNNASGNAGELVVGTAVKSIGNIGNNKQYEIVLDITNISGLVDVKVGTRKVSSTTALKMFSLVLT